MIRSDFFDWILASARMTAIRISLCVLCALCGLMFFLSVSSVANKARLNLYLLQE